MDKKYRIAIVIFCLYILLNNDWNHKFMFQVKTDAIILKRLILAFRHHKHQNKSIIPYQYLIFLIHYGGGGHWGGGGRGREGCVPRI